MMLEACAPVQRAGSIGSALSPLQLRWREDWSAATGRGVSLGLIDTDFDQRHPDLLGASLTVRNFAGPTRLSTRLRQHGTYSVTTIAGQGHRFIRGIAPGVRLLVATVVNSNGAAVPRSVADGIVWLMENGAKLIALPIGSTAVHEELADTLRAATNKGAIFFAATGSGWSNELLFPASERIPIAVAASDDGGTLCFHGDDTSRIDLVAPGWNIVGSVSINRTVERSGSSVACVMAAAVAALALSADSFGSRRWSRRTLLRMLRGLD